MMNIAVISCAHYAWLESSREMGVHLAGAIGNGTESHVHVPIDREGLRASLADADFAIVHTHGSREGFFAQRADGKSTVIATLSDVLALPECPKLKLVLITACETARGGDDNIAAALSTRIAKNGLVLANRYVVYGASYDFGDRDGRHGWVGYRNGKPVLTEDALPAVITMRDAYTAYLNCLS